MAELQKIKREKAVDEREKEEKRQQEEEKIRMENILSGNPLLREKYSGPTNSDKSDMKIKRRWDDDVVFKNEPDKKEKLLSMILCVRIFTENLWTNTSSNGKFVQKKTHQIK